MLYYYLPIKNTPSCCERVTFIRLHIVAKFFIDISEKIMIKFFTLEKT